METCQTIKTVRVGRYLLPGNPIPLTRAKFGDGRFWDSNKSSKTASIITLQNQHNEEPFFSGPLHLNISFYLQLTSRKNTSLHLKPHCIRPNIDSLIKYVTEVCEGVLFEEDKTIACLVAQKQFSTNPRTEIILSELSEEIW